MTKMAAMPIYGKNPLTIFFSGTGRPISTRAVIDIGDIDISIKMSCDIDIDIENVDIDILELGVTPVVELASLTPDTLTRGPMVL